MKVSIAKAARAAALATVLLLSAAALFACGKTEQKSYASSRAELAAALAGKEETVYVGDIEFSEDDLYLAITRSVKLVGRPEGSRFTKAHIVLSGPVVESETISVSFENIDFDGCYELPAKDPGSFESFDALLGDRKDKGAVSGSGFLALSIKNCSFTRYAKRVSPVLNLNYTDGGADIGTRASLELSGCSFTANVCERGVVWINGKNTKTLIKECSFTGNYCFTGVVNIGGINGEIDGLTVKDNNRIATKKNVYVHSGGGLAVAKSECTIKNCLIQGNSGTNGGGVSLAGSTVLMQDCSVIGNRADGYGGGMLVHSGEDHPVYITNCIISGNSAGELEGGIMVWPADQINIGLPTGIVEFSFCTIEGNESPDKEHLVFHDMATESPETTVGRNGSIDFYACRISDPAVTPLIKDGEDGNLVNSEGKGPAVSQEIVKKVAGGLYAQVRRTMYAGASEPQKKASLINLLPIGAALLAALALLLSKRLKSGTVLASSSGAAQGDMKSGTVLASSSGLPGAAQSETGPVLASSSGLPGATQSETGTVQSSPSNGASSESGLGATVGEASGPGAAVGEASCPGAAVGEASCPEAAVGAASGSEAAVGEPSVPEAALAKDTSAAAARAFAYAGLTEREQEVLQLYLAGKKRQDIAAELFISESTVKNHISNIFAKLGVKNKDELTGKLGR